MNKVYHVIFQHGYWYQWDNKFQLLEAVNKNTLLGVKLYNHKILG